MPLDTATPMTPAWPAVLTLAQRELVRFFRQRNRVFGALGQPIIFWLLFSEGLRGNDLDYAHFFPGTLVMILLFTAIFATISVVEDRKTGFLQGVLAAPVPRWSIVAGQAAGSTALAVVQGSLLLLLAPVAGLRLTPAGALASVMVMILMAFSLSGLGLLLAWRLDSTQGFHAIMNLLLLPMWFLSGAFFPAAGAPAWLGWAMSINPMTYGMSALRHSLQVGTGQRAAQAATWPALGVLALFGALAFSGAVLTARRASR